jgi:hypothetical protein
MSRKPYDPRTIAAVVAMLEARINRSPQCSADFMLNRQTYAALAELGALPIALPTRRKQVIQ